MMEKLDERLLQVRTRPRPRRQDACTVLLWAVVASILVIVPHRSFFFPAPENVDFTESKADSFDWKKIKPEAELTFHPCLDLFQCARLEVPLDWNATDEKGGAKAAIAIIKQPATVPITDPRYGGPVLFNPGGPGGSGVGFFLRYGIPLQQILDLGNEPGSEERFYDVLSWDPRGVNNTEPVHPGISNPERLREWAVQEESIGWSLENPETFNKVWSLNQLYGQTISTPEASGARQDEHVGRFVSTAVVVRDMVEIIERHGEWRSKEARRLLGRSKRDAATEAATARAVWIPGEEKLQYWGFSYGTIVGQTFASMYPSRVGRLVLDGVVDAEDYMAMGWSTNLWDIDKITANFTQTCVAAGAERCPIAQWAPGDGEKLLAELHQRLEALKQNPLTILVGDDPTLVSHSTVVELLFVEWYNGFAGFRRAAELLWELTHGNTTLFATLRAPYSCARPGAFAHDVGGAAAAIRCTDGAPLLDQSKAAYRAHLARLRAQSPLFADTWARIPLACHGYRVRPKWRFAGPFGANVTATASAGDSNEIETAPILFVSQTLDPVTPLRNAVAAARRFPGSQLLEAQGVGHASIGYPNVCAMRQIAGFFRTGRVAAPPAGEAWLKCPAMVGPFETEPSGGLWNWSVVEKGMWRAAREIAETWPGKQHVAI